MSMTELARPSAQANKWGVAPGDIFYCSWGYDQTNVDYYQVVRVTNSKAEVLPIGSTCVEAHGPGGNRVVPNPFYVREYDVLIDINRGDEKRTKLCTISAGYQGEPSIVLKSGQYWAWKYTGGSNYETDIVYGH